MSEREITKKINEDIFLIEKSVDDEILRDKFLRENYFLRNLYQEMNTEFYNIIKPIINSKEFKATRLDLHHDNLSTYSHMLHVSWIAYNIAKKKNLDYKSAAIGGILHDFYLYDWHTHQSKKTGVFNMHLFEHPIMAAKNAKKRFPKLINKKIENMILAHSWHSYIIKKIFVPSFNLYKYFPHSKEAWVVSKADVIASMYSAQTFSMLLGSLGMDKYVDKVKYWALKSHTYKVLLCVFH